MKSVGPGGLPQCAVVDTHVGICDAMSWRGVACGFSHFQSLWTGVRVTTSFRYPAGRQAGKVSMLGMSQVPVATKVLPVDCLSC